jgi:hypothetical protein
MLLQAEVQHHQIQLPAVWGKQPSSERRAYVRHRQRGLPTLLTLNGEIKNAKPQLIIIISTRALVVFSLDLGLKPQD